MKHRQFLWVGALVVVALLVGACGGAAATPTAEPAFRVAAVFPGSISDKGFNQSGYEGLKAIEKELGAEIAYSETTPVANFEQVYRDFASQGFDVIIGHGFEFGDVALKVAPDYPDVKFVVDSNNMVSGPNISGLMPKSWDAAYLAGVVAGSMSKSGKIGGVAGFDFPVIVAQMEAYKLGAQSVNPDAEVTLVYIGTFDDVAKGKEAALAQISAGADVIYHIADAAGVGVIQAAEEQGVYAIGWGLDQNSIAPKTVIASQIVDLGRLLLLEATDIKAGNFKGEVRFFGLDTGVTGLSDFHGLVPDDVAAKVEQVKQDIIAGKLEVPFIPAPTQ